MEFKSFKAVIQHAYDENSEIWLVRRGFDWKNGAKELAFVSFAWDHSFSLKEAFWDEVAYAQPWYDQIISIELVDMLEEVKTTYFFDDKWKFSSKEDIKDINREIDRSVKVWSFVDGLYASISFKDGRDTVSWFIDKSSTVSFVLKEDLSDEAWDYYVIDDVSEVSYPKTI